MNQCKKDFPIFSKHPELVYLDNAATSHKPQSVIDEISSYYENNCSNVHRGVHQLSDVSTTVFEKSKQEIANFFGAKNSELILTRNATEALNGLAYGWAEKNLNKGDVILISLMEHHANIVPWQELAKKKNIRLIFIDVDKNGLLDLSDLEEKIKLYGKDLKLISIAHVSNTLGTVNPINKVIELVKSQKISCKIALDGAQSAPHMKVDFSSLGIDFYAFSGHKMLGPMGIGGLIVREAILKSNEMSPWLFGGGMIDSVYQDKTTYNEDLSERFIAGTPDVASTAGLAAACRYLSDIGMKEVENHDRELVAYTLEKIQVINEVNVIGPTNPEHRLGSVAFVYKGVHAHDVAQVLDNEQIAVRSGHHCTMPLHLKNNWIATVRASFSIYNNTEDVDKLVEALKQVKKIFS